MSARFKLRTLMPERRMVMKTTPVERINIAVLSSVRMVIATLTERAAMPPANVVAPNVSPAVPYVGAVLVCSEGTWTGTDPIFYSYQWYKQDGSGSSPIAGKRRDSLTVTPGLLGYSLYCIVTAINSDGSAAAPSNLTDDPVIEPILPSLISGDPVITGNVDVDETLQVSSVGVWDGLPSPTFSYQWRMNGLNIAGATKIYYNIEAGQETATFDCVITATNIAGSTSAISNTLTSGTMPVNITAPVVTGIVRVGETLSSTAGVWSGSPTAYSYQWLNDGLDIVGENGDEYIVQAGDIDAEISCRVTAHNAAGAASEESNAVTSVWRPILLAKPSVLIWDSQDPYCSGGATAGAPVALMRSINGTQLFTQALTSAQPVMTSSGVVFDGLDDMMRGDVHAAAFNDEVTFIVGFDNPEDATTATRTLFSTSQTNASSVTYQVSMNYSRPGAPSAARQRFYVADSATSSTSLASLSPLGAGPYDVLARVGSPGGAVEVAQLDAGLTPVGAVGTRPNNVAPNYAWLSLGARAVGSGPTIAQYWQGRIRHIVIDEEVWDDATALLYRDCAIAAGVMT